MKILIDIGHPAHVHYFKNFIKVMEADGHSFLVVARDKEIAHILLKKFGIEYKTRGKGGTGILGKLIYLIKGSRTILRYGREFGPDIFLSFASPYAAIASLIIGKPHIAFDDTEHAKLEQLIFLPFTKTVFTPKCFYKNFGKKQIKFNGYMELCYLHPKWYNPDPVIYNILGIAKDEKFIIVRFVAWAASHDVGYHGFDAESKISIIKELSKYIKVFISAEGDLPSELEPFKVKFSPELMHDALHYATLFLGEGGTMASESSILGVPAIYVNTIPLMGYLKDERDVGLLYHFNDSNGIIEKAVEILSIDKEVWKLRQKELLKDKIDVTSFMIWFIANYPNSLKIMERDNNYQNRFR